MSIATRRAEWILIFIGERGFVDNGMPGPMRTNPSNPNLCWMIVGKLRCSTKRAPKPWKFRRCNKRVARGSCLIFLELNGYQPAPDSEDWEKLTRAVAAGILTREEITATLRKLLG